MIYSFKSRIRYSETGRDTALTFPAMMDYFQDTSTFHGEDSGLSLSALYEKNLAWILCGWQVRIFGHVHLNDNVIFSTWAYDFKGSIGFRNYSLTDEGKNLCAAADTRYVLMDIARQKPVKIPDYLVKGYSPEPDLRIDVGIPRKIPVAKQEKDFPGFTAAERMIDSNNHVNNSQYIKAAMSYIPDGFSFNAFRAEYKSQARLGDVLYPSVSDIENGIQVKLYGADRKLYFAAEWWTDKNPSGESHASLR